MYSGYAVTTPIEDLEKICDTLAKVETYMQYKTRADAAFHLNSPMPRPLPLLVTETRKLVADLLLPRKVDGNVSDNS